mgnify:FL=1
MTGEEFKRMKAKADVSQVFLTFMSLVGDVDRTAAALDLDPKFVTRLAEEEGWVTKIRRVSLLTKSEKPGDYERGVNRALAFVQGHRLRLVIDKIISRFDGMTPEEVAEELSTADKLGNRHVSARFFADLAAAMEKANTICFHALGDTVSERKERDAVDGEATSAAALHASLIAALNTAAAEPVRQTLEATTDSVSQAIVAQLSQSGTPETSERSEPEAAEGGEPPANPK